MTGIPWSQEQMLLFLEALESEPIIWDPNNSGHRDRKKVNDAWVRIQKIFNIPIENLKKKKESLFATYRGYHRKTEASNKSGLEDGYRPAWFAFEYMDNFLGPVFKCKQAITADKSILPDSLECKEEKDSSWTSEQTTFPSPIPADTIISMGMSDQCASQNRICRRRLNPELQMASEQMSEAFNNLNNVINRGVKDDTEDECDIFGKLIAKKLKKMPEQEREDLMFDIHALFRRPRGLETPSSIESGTYLKNEN